MIKKKPHVAVGLVRQLPGLLSEEFPIPCVTADPANSLEARERFFEIPFGFQAVFMILLSGMFLLSKNDPSRELLEKLLTEKGLSSQWLSGQLVERKPEKHARHLEVAPVLRGTGSPCHEHHEREDADEDELCDADSCDQCADKRMSAFPILHKPDTEYCDQNTPEKRHEGSNPVSCISNRVAHRVGQLILAVFEQSVESAIFKH